MSAPNPTNERREHHRHKPHVHDDHVEEGWLVSYADMMTLLFGFFVIMFSMSTLEKKKFEQMSAEMEKQFKEAKIPAAPEDPKPTNAAEEVRMKEPDPSAELVKVLKQQIEHAGMNTKEVEITEDPNGVTISLRGSTFFGPGQTNLAAAGGAFVAEVGRTLLGLKTPFQARVEGHTDDTPINSPIYPTNWELSSARAAGVVRKLADMGVAPDHLVAAGYGSSRPIFPNRDAKGEALQENMAKNRRVVLYIALDEKRSVASTAPATAAPIPAQQPVQAPTVPGAKPAPTAAPGAQPQAQVPGQVPGVVPATQLAHPPSAPVTGVAPVAQPAAAAPGAPQAAAVPARPAAAMPAPVSQAQAAAVATKPAAPSYPANAPAPLKALANAANAGNYRAPASLPQAVKGQPLPAKAAPVAQPQARPPVAPTVAAPAAPVSAQPAPSTVPAK